MILVSSCSCLCPIHWTQGLCREWTSEWSTMILPTKMRLLIVILLLLLLSFTLSLSLSIPLSLSSFQGTEWLPENQRRLATPPVNQQPHAPWRDSEDQAGDDFEDCLVSRGGGDARRGILAWRALWRRGRCRPTWRHLVVSWRLPRTRHRFWPIPGLGDEKILLPMALSWHVSPDVSSNCWIE